MLGEVSPALPFPFPFFDDFLLELWGEQPSTPQQQQLEFSYPRLVDEIRE
jgi:hypothetical protein